MSGPTQFITLPRVPGGEWAGAAFVPMLRAILDGELISGDEIRSQVWAARLGLTAVHVEDAVTRFGHLGLIEYTDEDDDALPRMTCFTHEEAVLEAKSWVTTTLELISAVPRVRGARMRRMRRARDAYARS